MKYFRVFSIKGHSSVSKAFSKSMKSSSPGISTFSSMVKNLPSQYVFQLLPCYQNGCPHPVCISGKPETEYCWYEGGPPLSYLPIPIPDPKRPWGDRNCASCPGHCSGHYLNAQDRIKEYYTGNGTTKVSNPPSETFKILTKKATADIEIAKQMLLPVDEVKMWSKHISDVARARKLGAKKAAATRRANKKGKGNFKIHGFSSILYWWWY